MRSLHADTFNHDEEAAGYDADVADEGNPIRAGYAAMLGWVAHQAGIGPTDVVVDLGIGTGNLASRLPRCGRLIGVDVSAGMLALAGAKLGAGAREVGPGAGGAEPADVMRAELVQAELVQADLLEFLERPGTYDAIVSTYAIHHLVAEEKAALIERAAARLAPGGRLAVGDLMVAGRSCVDAMRTRLGHPDVDELFAEEFPWFVDETLVSLAAAGFTGVVAEQVSELSWGVAARRPLT